MTVEATPAPARDRAPELDLLRFIAATLVVIYHYAYRPAINGEVSTTAFGALQDFATYGYLGVPLFFLISGFVIVWSAAGRTPGQFLRSRFLRLYPMFWLGVAITLFACWLADFRPEVLNIRVILANLTLVPAYFDVPFIDGVYWTLAIELKFYLIILGAILLGQMRRIELWMYFWIAASVVLTLWTVPLGGSAAMLPHGFLFAAGATCYFVRTSGLTAARVIALTVAAAGSTYHGILGRGNFTFEDQMASPVMVGVLIVAFHLGLLAVAMRWIRVGNSAIWFSLGALTYPLYLLHNVVGRTWIAALEPYTNEWTRLGIVMVLAYALAWVCARYFEPAVRDAIARLLDRIGGARTGVRAPSRAGE
jgi:peptidoglycan/LPS O-acetylase OafA/YrhL